jgi:diguanylate cyclase (GGDEF)-like protein
MVWILVSAASAALAVAASVVLTLRARARYERRLEAVLRRLDEQLTPISESLERAVERTSAARDRVVDEGEPAASPALEQLQRDELTGLRNRRGYELELEREVDTAQRTGRPLSVVLLDLDEPGRVGSQRDPESERLLQEFATLLLGLTRATDTVCRCGADEFGVVLPATTAEGAQRFHARVREEITSTTLDRTGRMTFSVGLVEWRPNETSDSLDARVAAAVGSVEPSAGNGVHRLNPRRGD